MSGRQLLASTRSGIVSPTRSRAFQGSVAPTPVAEGGQADRWLHGGWVCKRACPLRTEGAEG